jgi:transcriptional regulator with XRE-family HTH domain
MRIGSELRRWRSSRRVSQYELALRAGTTQRHVSFIESGRSKPGRAIVARLAESLGLSLRERNALLQAAGYAPVYPESSLDAPALLPVREALTSIVNGHEPYPAMVLGNYGEVLAANSAIDVLTEGASVPLLQPPINLLRIMVHPDGMARRVENLGDWGRHIVANLHARAVRNPDPRLDELIVELSGYLAATPPTNDQLGFSVPLRLRSTDGDLRLITTLTWFATATDITLAELHLEAFLPADDESATILQARARRRDVRSARRVKTDRRPR